MQEAHGAVAQRAAFFEAAAAYAAGSSSLLRFDSAAAAECDGGGIGHPVVLSVESF
jgi:hypothetical protein